MDGNSRPTQTDRVFNYIEEFGSINTFQAFTDLGISRLSARIWELRNMGIKINKESYNIKNRFGKNVTVYRYSFA